MEFRWSSQKYTFSLGFWGTEIKNVKKALDVEPGMDEHTMEFQKVYIFL